MTVRRGISKRSHEKIEASEQSNKLLFDKCHVPTLPPVLMAFLPISFFPGLIQKTEKEMPGKYTVVADL